MITQPPLGFVRFTGRGAGFFQTLPLLLAAGCFWGAFRMAEYLWDTREA